MGVMRFTAVAAGLGDTRFSAPMSDEKEKMYASQASAVTKSFSHSCAGKTSAPGKDSLQSTTENGNVQQRIFLFFFFTILAL